MEGRDHGLRMYIETKWSATNKDKRGCLNYSIKSTGGTSLEDGTIATGREQWIRLKECTDVRLDLTLSIVKTQPFVIPFFEPVTMEVTGTDKFRFSYCDLYSSNRVPETCRSNNFLGGNFEVFNSNQPLTINLTKTVRPIKSASSSCSPHRRGRACEGLNSHARHLPHHCPFARCAGARRFAVFSRRL